MAFAERGRPWISFLMLVSRCLWGDPTLPALPGLLQRPLIHVRPSLLRPTTRLAAAPRWRSATAAASPRGVVSGGGGAGGRGGSGGKRGGSGSGIEYSVFLGQQLKDAQNCLEVLRLVRQGQCDLKDLTTAVNRMGKLRHRDAASRAAFRELLVVAFRSCDK